MHTDESQSVGQFPTTHWSLVNRAAGQDVAVRGEAIAELLKKYLPALRSVLRFYRVPASEGEDILQSFICDRVIQQNILSCADQTRGRFRSFIFASLRNFMLNWARSARASKRSSKMPLLSLDVDPGIDVEAKALCDDFDNAWVRTLLQQTLDRMHTYCSRNDSEVIWEVFDQRLLKPSYDGTTPISYEELTARLKLKSPAQAANMLVTAKRIFARTLRSVVAEYARDEDEIAEELSMLRALSL